MKIWGGSNHPHSQSGGGRTTPMPKGVVWPPLKGHKKKKEEKWVKMGFGLLWVAGPPPRAWDGFGHPIPTVGDGEATLKAQNPF